MHGAMVNIVTPFSEELAPSTLLRLAAVAIAVYRAGLRGQPSFSRRVWPRGDRACHIYVWGYTAVWGQSGVVTAQSA